LEPGDLFRLKTGDGGEGRMRRIELLHDLREHFELLPIRGVFAIALGFITEAPKEQRGVIAMLHDLIHALVRSASRSAWFGIREPIALGLQPDACAHGEPTLLGGIEDGPQAIGGPGADAVSAGGRQLIEMLVASRTFDEVRLASASDALTRHDDHGHRLGGCVGDDGEEKEERDGDRGCHECGVFPDRSFWACSTHFSR
jgi:hypothetical protein